MLTLLQTVRLEKGLRVPVGTGRDPMRAPRTQPTQAAGVSPVKNDKRTEARMVEEMLQAVGWYSQGWDDERNSLLMWAVKEVGGMPGPTFFHDPGEKQQHRMHPGKLPPSTMKNVCP